MRHKYIFMQLIIDIQLHSQPAYWERSHQGSWERSQLAWSEHYTIYNAASCLLRVLSSVWREILSIIIVLKSLVSLIFV